MSAGGGGAASLCSATINYGASVGDASKRSTTDVPIFVGSFDVVVMQPPLPKVSWFSPYYTASWFLHGSSSAVLQAVLTLDVPDRHSHLIILQQWTWGGCYVICFEFVSS